MVDPIEHPNTAERIRNETRATSPEGAETPQSSAPPPVERTVGRPQDIPKAGSGPLWAWLGIPVLLAIFVAVVFWLLPALHSNQENRTDPVRGDTADQPSGQR